jgi:DNA repair exonuclease SbcCD ATPase subunit
MSEWPNDDAITRIERALYDLSHFERCGIDASTLRNVLTNLGPAIRAELDKARAEERARHLADLKAEADGGDCPVCGQERWPDSRRGSDEG